MTGDENLAFFDAIAPIIYFDSINMNIAWFQSRYDKGFGKDYINCPLSKEQYYNFINDLINSKKIEFKNWEKTTPYFEGCIPIEDPIEANIGRSIETVAKFDVISVKKLTDKTSNNKIINGEKFFKKID